MKKLLVLIVVVAVFVALFMPYVTGRVAEEATLQLASQVNANSEEYGELEVVEYDRGYGSTQSNFSWSPGGSYGALMSGLFGDPVRYSCEGDHGVLEYSYECRPLNVEAYKEFVEQELGGKDPLTISGSVSVFGTLTQTLNLEEFELNNEEQEKLKVLPGQLSIKSDRELNNFAVDGDFEGLVASGADGDFAVNGLSVNGNIRLNQHRLAIGDMELTAQDIGMQSDSDGEVQFQGLSMRSVATEQGDTMAIEYGMSLDKVIQTEATEPVDMNDIELDLQLQGIDMEQLGNFTKKYQELSKLPPEESNAARLTMMSDLEGLLKSGLKLNTTASANYASEPMYAKLDVELVGNLSLGDFVLLAVNPQGLFSKFKAHMNTQVPKVVLEGNETAMAALASNPLYIESDRSYNSDIELIDNDVTINGNKMSIEELLALLMQAAG
ncbi:MAG: DUF945 family protein [Pseudomonadota bacterium]